MKKSILLTVLASVTLVATMPAYAANSTASSSSANGGMGAKMKNGAKAVGNGIMWGPRKIGAGFKKMFKKS